MIMLIKKLIIHVVYVLFVHLALWDLIVICFLTKTNVVVTFVNVKMYCKLSLWISKTLLVVVFVSVKIKNILVDTDFRKLLV